ncbi:hypothetical protein ACWC9R_10780 [Streptomyces sp. NPDC001219]
MSSEAEVPLPEQLGEDDLLLANALQAAPGRAGVNWERCSHRMR